MSSAERNRKHAVIAVVLLALMLIGAGFTLFFYGEWSVASSTLTETLWQTEMINYTLQQINATAPKVTITLTFTPAPPEKQVLPNTVTFLTGYITATNLTGLYYPCTLTANFTVTHSTTNPNMTIDYIYIPFQMVYLLKGIQYVEIPWGIFPLSIYNSRPGDQITLYITGLVTIYWEPVHAPITVQTVTGQFRIQVIGG